MKRNYLIIMLVVGTIVIVTGYIFNPFLKVESFVLSEVFSEEVKERFAPSGRIYVGYCKINLVRPVIYTIFNEGENEQYVIYTAISRKSIFSQRWEYEYVLNNIGSTTLRNKNYETTIKFYRQNSCEYIRNIKNDSNVSFSKPLSEEEISAFNNSEQQIKDAEQANKQKDEAYNSLSPEEKIKDNDSKIKLYSEAVNQLNQGIVVYVDGTPIDSGDFNVYDKVERGYVVEYYQEYITQLEEKNRELRDG